MNATWYAGFIVALAGSFFSCRAEDSSVAGPGFEPAHYEALWQKSPFAVATPDAAPTSVDYSLVGVARIDGVFYASVIKKQTQEHFLVSTDAPVQGLKLISVDKGTSASETVVTLENNGAPLSLKLDTSAVVSPAAPPPSGVSSQVTFPNQPQSFNSPGMHPFTPMIHRPMIHVPPPPSAPPK